MCRAVLEASRAVPTVTYSMSNTSANVHCESLELTLWQTTVCHPADCLAFTSSRSRLCRSNRPVHLVCIEAMPQLLFVRAAAQQTELLQPCLLLLSLPCHLPTAAAAGCR